MSRAKSSVDQIRRRFDAEVDRFCDLEAGQSATMDAPLTLALTAQAAAAVTPHAASLLDIGCGAGNYSLKLLEHQPGMDVTLLDLSGPMLDRASERVSVATTGHVQTVRGDVREVSFPAGSFDIVVAAAVLHHLRTDEQWDAVFASIHRWLRPGGGVWVVDLVAHTHAPVQRGMWDRYGDYLTGLKGPEYRDRVLDYIEAEDSPRSVTDQLDRLRAAGFKHPELLHKHNCFAAFGALKCD